MSSIIVRRDIDLNTKLSGFEGCLPISIEKEKKVGVELSRRIGNVNISYIGVSCFLFKVDGLILLISFRP